MENLYNLFITPLSETYFQKALIGGCVVAIVSGVLGSFIILRKMSFLGDALSHAMIAGVAGGYLFMKLVFGIEAYAPGMLLGSLIAAIITVGLIGFVSRVSRIKEDAVIGVMYVGIFALGVILVSIFRSHIHIDLMHFIMGDILGVADTDLWIAAFITAVVLTVLILFFRYFQVTTFDPVMAASIGIPVLLFSYLLTTCVSLVVVSAVSMIGVIMVVGLLITPAATAYLLSDRLDRMMILAGIFGMTSVIGGLYMAVWMDSSGGGAVMLFGTLQFLVVLYVAPRYGILAGWLRRRRMVPQTLIEDILGSLSRNPDNPLSISTISEFISADIAKLNKAVQSMVRDGLIEKRLDGIILTKKGRTDAEKVLRAHRIWETYLQSVGEPEEKLHEKAHELEHVYSDDSVDYLDQLLGHPEKDPHGKDIPQIQPSKSDSKFPPYKNL
jgi:ABC-type Mn2+/Zn2+ transport system permease subunit/Mn-dependent DtxR family transcriptional regulator